MKISLGFILIILLQVRINHGCKYLCWKKISKMIYPQEVVEKTINHNANFELTVKRDDSIIDIKINEGEEEEKVDDTDKSNNEEEVDDTVKAIDEEKFDDTVTVKHIGEEVEVKNSKRADMKPNSSAKIGRYTIKLYLSLKDSFLRYNYKTHEIRDESNALLSQSTPLPQSIIFNFLSGLSFKLTMADLNFRKVIFGKKVEFDATLHAQQIIISCNGFFLLDKKHHLEFYYMLIRTDRDDGWPGILFKTVPQTISQKGTPTWTLTPNFWFKHKDGNVISLKDWDAISGREHYLNFKSLDVTFFS